MFVEVLGDAVKLLLVGDRAAPARGDATQRV